MKKIKIIYSVLLVFCLFFSCKTMAIDSNSFKVLIFGDSLSAGYKIGSDNSFATLLSNNLKEKGYQHVQIINRSVSGETTVGGLRRLPSVLSHINPDAVVLELGVNDVFKGFSVSSIEQNLSDMITLCQKKNISVLLVGMQAPPYAELSYQRAFNGLYKKLATRYRLILYPFFMKGLFALENGAIKPQKQHLLSDMIHPNVSGVQLMVDNFMPYMIRFLKENKIYPKK